MKAIIMAGGKGARLRPLTSDLPKPMAPLLGRPCAEYVIDLLRQNGIEDLAATVMYEKEKMTDFLSAHNVRIFEEKKPLGTAGSVKNCESFVDGDFCVISADAVCDFDLSAAVDFHRSHGGIVTIVVTHVQDPLEYGVCVLNEQKQITRFIEKPSWERVYSGTVNTGVYLFSKEIFNYIEPGKRLDFSQDIFPELMRRGQPIYGYEAKGYWCDIGNPRAYLRCQFDLLDNKTKLPLPVSGTPHGATVIPPCFIGKNVKADGAVIGPYAVIGDDCILEPGSRTEHSVVLNGTHICDGAALRRCVIGSDCVIGRNASIGDYSVLGSECHVQSDCVVGAQSRIYPKITLPEGGMVRGNVFREFHCFDPGASSGADLKTELSVFPRIGAAFGSIFKGNIAIGYEDDEICSQMFGIVSGILGSGSNVLSLGACDKNVLRYIVRVYGLDAGVFVGTDQIYLYEEDGLPLSSQSQRAFRNVFEMNDFACVQSGKYRRFKGYLKTYMDRLKQYAVNIRPLNMHILAPEFVAQIIPSRTNDTAQRLYVGDGLTVDEYPQRIVRCAVVVAYGRTYGRVYIPYDFPSVIDELGQTYGFEVIRLTLDDADRRRLYDMTDPNVMAVVLCRYLSKNHLTFEELAKSLPRFSVYARDIECETDKCLLMQHLSTMADTEKELIEGIKIIDAPGHRSVRIVPKRDLHGFRLIAEAASTEAAAEICDFYVKKMKSDGINVDIQE